MMKTAIRGNVGELLDYISEGKVPVLLWAKEKHFRSW
jgi:hypothetical protein